MCCTMDNRNLKVRRLRTTKGNRLWRILLIMTQDPTRRNLSVRVNGLIRLTSYGKATTINWVTIRVNIGNVHRLIIRRVVNVNGLVRPVSNLILTWR